MFDLARIGPGCRVLDVAAGAGEQSISAARRVGTNGHVLATDIAPALLERAAADARKAGLSNLETREIDGEALDVLPAASFDAAISRVGLIYFPDQQRALAGICRALRPGGRVAAIVYSTADNNAFFSIPVRIIRERAQLPPPLPGQPGPFSLGAEGVLEAAFAKAGLRDIEVRKVPSPVKLTSAAECVRFERESFGALHQMMVGLSDAERAQAWQAIEEALSRFETVDGFVGPCEMLVGVGVVQRP
ncbi:methyltransferase domain-containing protein [Variovorax sp. J22P240]|nr:methyltransferase domain-containing protein [Variovorax sp. J22P240]MDM0001862.1 methyltransferase domain-containing protein [Variovorax sp. J22P240]